VFAIAIRHLALVVIRDLDVVSITVNKPEADEGLSAKVLIAA
jgi:hypothetical protein